MEAILNLYNLYGNSQYFGEAVSKTTHMIQAAVAAQNNNEPDYLVLACLLHDIGHFLEEDNMNGLGVIEHGKVGADFLRSLKMNEKVCCLVENHVLAKKYLVSKYDDYYNKLSDASKQTLEFQGGKMTPDQMKLFENDSNFNDSLKVRNYDDIGKNINTTIPKLETFIPLINKYLDDNIYKDYSNSLKKNGYLLIKNYFKPDEIFFIKHFKQYLQQLKEEKGKYMIYHETINNKNMRSRIEHFVPYFNNINDLLKNNIEPLLEKILEEKIVLFKDKLNWKYPNGNGFKAHQDHPAWNDFPISRFYSVALFADDATKANGCLEIVKENNNTLYNNDGCINTAIENSLHWEYLETTSADLLIFDSFIPHRSAKNTTSKSRSIFYFTFNKLSEGNYYNDYVKNKRKYFPPPNERTNTVNIKNNKYNLGNPLK